jgi:cytochrome b subunit of formate dehydrogenase
MFSKFIRSPRERATLEIGLGSCLLSINNLDRTGEHMRILSIIIGIVVAAIGGVIAYRAYFIEPSSAVVVTNTDVREFPNMVRIASGIILVFIGAAMAIFAARRKPM